MSEPILEPKSTKSVAFLFTTDFQYTKIEKYRKSKFLLQSKKPSISSNFGPDIPLLGTIVASSIA